MECVSNCSAPRQEQRCSDFLSVVCLFGKTKSTTTPFLPALENQMVGEKRGSFGPGFASQLPWQFSHTPLEGKMGSLLEERPVGGHLMMSDSKVVGLHWVGEVQKNLDL